MIRFSCACCGMMVSAREDYVCCATVCPQCEQPIVIPPGVPPPYPVSFIAMQKPGFSQPAPVTASRTALRRGASPGPAAGQARKSPAGRDRPIEVTPIGPQPPVVSRKALLVTIMLAVCGIGGVVGFAALYSLSANKDAGGSQATLTRRDNRNLEKPSPEAMNPRDEPRSQETVAPPIASRPFAPQQEPLVQARQRGPATASAVPGAGGSEASIAEAPGRGPPRQTRPGKVLGTLGGAEGVAVHPKDGNALRVGPGGPSPPLADQVSAFLRGLKGNSPRERDDAQLALEALGPAASVAVPALIEAMRSKDRDLRVRAAQVLRKVDPKQVATAYVTALADTDEEVRGDAIDALGAIGASAQEATTDLRRALKDDSALLRVKAARALWSIEQQVYQVDQTLREGLKDGDARVRREAADGLATMGSHIPRSAVLALTRALRDSDAEVRRLAMAALRKAPAGDQALIAPLVAGLADEGLRDEIITMLLPYGEDAVEALLEALKDQQDSVRLGAVLTLGKMGTKAKAAYEPLIVVFRRDPVPAIREAASTALGQIRRR